MAGIRVLLVEDDWIIAKEISYTLQDLGFDVIGSFDTGEEALKGVKALQPDIVLLDIDLSSEHTGIDVARRLKAESSVPFVFLTENNRPTPSIGVQRPLRRVLREDRSRKDENGKY